jgi:hypothetical protein
MPDRFPSGVIGFSPESLIALSGVEMRTPVSGAGRAGQLLNLFHLPYSGCPVFSTILLKIYVGTPGAPDSMRANYIDMPM